MRKTFLFIQVFLLMINCIGCSAVPSAENVHKRIHEKYYNIESYTAKCTVTAFTKGGQNDYDCEVCYDSKNDTYTVTTDDMKIEISHDVTTIQRGDSSLNAPSSDDDMSIFINTFFKSYYESENTSMTVSSLQSETTLLECDVLNPTENTAKMKLWVLNENVLPVRMQVLGSDDFLHTEINFIEFNGYKIQNM